MGLTISQRWQVWRWRCQNGGPPCNRLLMRTDSIEVRCQLARDHRGQHYAMRQITPVNSVEMLAAPDAMPLYIDGPTPNHDELWEI